MTFTTISQYFNDLPKSFKIAITCSFLLPLKTGTAMTGYDLLWPAMASYDQLLPVITNYDPL